MLTRFHILRQGACDLGIWIQRSWLFLTTNIQLNSTLKREQRRKWMRYTVRLKAWRAKCFIVRRKVKPWALISAASDAVLGRTLQLNVILIFSFLRHTCIYIYMYINVYATWCCKLIVFTFRWCHVTTVTLTLIDKSNRFDIVALSWGDTETQSTFGFPIQSVAFD